MMISLLNREAIGAQSDPPGKPSQARSHLLQSEASRLALLAFLVYALAAVYLIFGLHYYAGDAVSRVANAYYVIFSRNPHLGAIGFIWNPLPSLLELPIVALHPWIPAVVTRGLAGSAVSVILGATAVYHLSHILERLSVTRLFRMVLTLCFMLNPLIMLYSANGMSDVMWVACILGTYSGVLDYVETGSLRRLISGALWLSAGFGMRYEAVPFGALLIFALIVGRWGKVAAAELRGSAIIFGAPVVFAGAVWIYFNWAIMKNPLYFLESSYGNLAQTATGAYRTTAMIRADHHLLGAFLYVAHFGLFYWPIYVSFLIALWFSFGKRRDPQAIVLLCGTIGAEILELALAYKGSLGQWDRYFLELIPNGILLTAYAMTKVRTKVRITFRPLKVVLGTALCLVFISGSVGTIGALHIHQLGQPDGAVLSSVFRGKSMRASSTQDPFSIDRQVVRYVDAHPHLSILSDTFTDWSVVIRARRLNQFVITSDYDFGSILHNPRGRIDAILVPQPADVAKLNAISRAWPGIWAGKIRWTRLIKSFPGQNHYRLYAVLPSAP